MNKLTLKTTRLILSELDLSDIDAIHNLHSLPETDEFNTMGIPENKEVTDKLVREWIAMDQIEPRNRYTFKIEVNQVFIGLCEGKSFNRNPYKHWD
jgi:[ribosomal protein S5]-alanine N-acetyltransferase